MEEQNILNEEAVILEEDNKLNDEKLISAFANFKIKFIKILNKIPTQEIALVLLILLSCLALYGVYDRCLNQYDLIALFYGKAIVIRLVGWLALINGLVDYLSKRLVLGKGYFKSTFIKSPWTGLLAILMIWALITSITSKDRYASFFGDAYRFDGYFSYIAYAGIFVSASLIHNKKYCNVLLNAFVIISVLLALFSFAAESFDFVRVLMRNNMVVNYSGTFVNSNHYGYYICLSLALTIGLFMEAKHIWSKIVYGIFFAINSILLMYNSTLGAFIAIIICLIIYTILYWIKTSFKKTVIIFTLFAILFLTAGVFNNHRMLTDTKTLFGDVGRLFGAVKEGAETGDIGGALDDVGDAGTGRTQLWVASVKIILDYPILGVGPENVQNFTPQYLESGSRQISHNEYLQIGANMGIPGMLIYIVALGWFIIYTFINIKKKEDINLNTFTAFIAYLVSALFGVALPIAICYMFMVFGLTNATYKKDKLRTMLE